MSVRDDGLWAMAAENLSNSSQLPELDLHGLAVHVAIIELESFLNAEFMAGTEAVKIICGIGTGVLLNNTKKLLEQYRQHGLVEDFIQVKSGGVIIVRLGLKD